MYLFFELSDATEAPWSVINMRILSMEALQISNLMGYVQKERIPSD